MATQDGMFAAGNEGVLRQGNRARTRRAMMQQSDQTKMLFLACADHLHAGDGCTKTGRSDIQTASASGLCWTPETSEALHRSQHGDKFLVEA